MDIGDVAQALYGEPPGDFVAARTAFVKEARASGDAALARRVGKLRKPTKAAWATNLLVRDDREHIDALQSLGSELREAQGRLVGAELRALTVRRRALVAELVAAARRLAEQAGTPLGDPGAEEVARTLDAALTDEGAVAALETGMLVESLMATGFEAIELEGKVAMPEAVAEVPQRPRLRVVPPPKETARRGKPAQQKPAQQKPVQQKPAPTKSAPKGPAAKKSADTRAEQAKAERRRKAAEDALDIARQGVEMAKESVASARAAVDDLDHRREQLQDQLDRLDGEIARARRDVTATRQAKAAAERDEATARRALDRLR